MSSFLDKYPFIKIALFILSCVGVYGGAVNYGAFDFFPAIPFLMFLIYASTKWKKMYLATMIILFFVCSILYILKKQHGPLFHPALGREFSFKQEMCLHKYYQGFVLAQPITEKFPCEKPNGRLGGLVATEILPANTTLKITRISISNADMGEIYVIHSPTPLGELYLSGNDDSLAQWPNGQIIQQQDLRRAVFYMPSLLMYWPLIPVTWHTL